MKGIFKNLNSQTFPLSNSPLCLRCFENLLWRLNFLKRHNSLLRQFTGHSKDLQFLEAIQGVKSSYITVF